VAGLSESAREVGGDYYDHVDLGGGRLLLVIADVSGKGVPAALLMSGFRAALVSQDLSQAKPEDVASRVNEFLNRSVEPGRFVTAFLGLLDAATGQLTYVNAGHNPPLLLRAGGAVESLEAGGVILGILPGRATRAAR
jgi:sigma-B regulation protein RsbU (phosphoserine phosphatase)